MQTKQIELFSYDAEWPQKFEVEAALITQELGDNCLEIHHIGSTSVPGLKAKNDLDVLCVVKELDPCLHLGKKGYTFKGEVNIPLRYFFSKNTLFSKVNLHVVQIGHGFIALNLCFRDYLRGHEERREAYQTLKEDLFKDPSSFEREGRFVKYSLRKDPFIKATLDHAGFDGLAINFCLHYREWEAYRRLREEKTPLSLSEDHYHFVLYKGSQIICAASVEFLDAKMAVLRFLSTDAGHRTNDQEIYLKAFLERWAAHHGRNLL